MSDTEKKYLKTMMFLNMDFRMTTLIPCPLSVNKWIRKEQVLVLTL